MNIVYNYEYSYGGPKIHRVDVYETVDEHGRLQGYLHAFQTTRASELKKDLKRIGANRQQVLRVANLAAMAPMGWVEPVTVDNEGKIVKAYR